MQLSHNLELFAAKNINSVAGRRGFGGNAFGCKLSFH